MSHSEIDGSSRLIGTLRVARPQFARMFRVPLLVPGFRSAYLSRLNRRGVLGATAIARAWKLRPSLSDKWPQESPAFLQPPNARKNSPPTTLRGWLLGEPFAAPPKGGECGAGRASFRRTR